MPSLKPKRRVQRAGAAMGRGFAAAGKAVMRGVNVVRGVQLSKRTLAKIRDGTYKSRFNTARVLPDGNIQVVTEDKHTFWAKIFDSNGRFLMDLNKMKDSGMIWSQRFQSGVHLPIFPEPTKKPRK